MELIVAAGLIPFKSPSLPNIGQDLRRIIKQLNGNRGPNILRAHRLPMQNLPIAAEGRRYRQKLAYITTAKPRAEFPRCDT
ncbi:hypothetical protein [Zobellella aerophila]|uniref:hypothetical protein n=1 Tax=Zobellella aerophila TaxID=870480 RepID=UPI0031F0A3F9